MLFASSSGELFAHRIHSFHETTMSHRSGALALWAAARCGQITKATLMEKPSRRGSRMAFGFGGYDR